jgi:hypothetical protein
MTYRKDIRQEIYNKAEEMWAKNETVFPGHDAKMEIVMQGLLERIQGLIKDSITFLKQTPGRAFPFA